MRHVKHFISSLLIIALLFGSGFFAGRVIPKGAIVSGATLGWKLPGEVERRFITKEEVSAQLYNIRELTTYSGQYTVTKSADYTRYLLDDIPIPGTTNSIEITCTGLVKVGYDIEKIVLKVDNESGKIYIKIPDPVVLDNYVIWDSLKVTEHNTLLNPLEFNQYQTLVGEIKVLGLAEVEKNGIYPAAKENLENLITGFLSRFEGFEVIFM